MVKYGAESFMSWDCFARPFVPRPFGQKPCSGMTKRRKYGCKWIFHLDSDSKNASKLTNKWLADHKITVFQRPSQFPGLNQIKVLWFELKWAFHKAH